MLQNNCRIEKLNGYHFYEKDILYDDYEFTYDIQLTANVTYITPGFGIALIDTESCSINDKPDTYLFKIGYREVSVYFSNNNKLTLIKQISCSEANTIQDNLIFTLKKQGRKVSIYLNDSLVLENYIEKALDKYSIGYYSNKGNIINTISFASNIPNNWVVNMKNTQGGYIRFLEDSFEIIDCKDNAEIEQSYISLQPGTYYIKCKLSAINNKNDLKYYIYLSDDDRYFDKDKNILVNDSFTLYKPTLVNLKITGTNGCISDIILSTDKDADYIPTSLNVKDFDGSYIDININDFNKITWKGIVYKTPYVQAINERIIYGLILDNLIAIAPEDTNILLNKQYNYEFNVNTYTFYIKDDEDNILFSQRLLNITNKITIFKNLSAKITQLTLYKKNNEVVDIITDDEEHISINSNITSPIIVVDKYNLPLDLSSSYRLCKYKDYDKYIFTNWEREYFYPSKTLKLDKRIIDQQDSVFIYGIRKDTKIDLNKIYDVEEDKINSIDLLTKEYDFISEQDILLIDKKQSIIYLKESQLKKYDLFIIDYLKDNSYCINYNYKKRTYDVNISSLEDTKVLYDSATIDSIDKTYTQINTHKVTNINGNLNGYIVLTGGDE